MTYYDILNFCREPIKRLTAMGFRADDCQYIELYGDFVRMRSGGGKTTWAVAVLAEKYQISERKVYSIIKRFGMRCTQDAV